MNFVLARCVPAWYRDGENGGFMRAEAQAAWQAFITKDEGNVAYMYLDTKMLVTVGIGNLIDPMSRALGLPFQYKANNAAGIPPGRAATRKEIEQEWLSIKSHPKKVILGLGKDFPPHWHKFTAACKKADFDTAAAQSHISNWRTERNIRSNKLFNNAARVLANPDVYNPEKVYYPVMLLDEIVARGVVVAQR